MLVARVYTVMDRMVVEVSCVHPGAPAEGHLVIREERSGPPASQRAALRALADVSDTAALLTAALEDLPVPGSIEDCERPWASPCG